MALSTEWVALKTGQSGSGGVEYSGTGEMKKRYGYVYVDRDNEGNGTLKRTPKDSFYWYKKAIASDGEDLSDN